MLLWYTLTPTSPAPSTSTPACTPTPALAHSHAPLLNLAHLLPPTPYQHSCIVCSFNSCSCTTCSSYTTYSCTPSTPAFTSLAAPSTPAPSPTPLLAPESVHTLHHLLLLSLLLLPLHLLFPISAHLSLPKLLHQLLHLLLHQHHLLPPMILDLFLPAYSVAS